MSDGYSVAYSESVYVDPNPEPIYRSMPKLFHSMCQGPPKRNSIDRQTVNNKVVMVVTAG